MRLKERYGSWALIAGASQGIGQALADHVAAEGVNCILVARSAGKLADLAGRIRSTHGVDCMNLAVDLSAPGAADAILETVGNREIGLFIYNAGADSNGTRFLDGSVENWSELAEVNIGTVTRLSHTLANRMKARKQGGIVLVGSGAGYGGSKFTSVYSGAKAYQMCFAEGLWSELRPHGVDVLFSALGPTDTPAFRDLLERKGVPLPPGLAEPGEVARQILAHLSEGPIFNWNQGDEDAGFLTTSAAQRRQRVLAVDAGSSRIFGE